MLISLTHLSYIYILIASQNSLKVMDVPKRLLLTNVLGSKRLFSNRFWPRSALSTFKPFHGYAESTKSPLWKWPTLHWQPTCTLSSSHISSPLFKEAPLSIFRLARLLACLGLPLPHKRRQTRLHSHNFNTLKLKKNTENTRPFNSPLPTESAREEKRLVDATGSDGYYKKKKTVQSSVLPQKKLQSLPSD